LVHRGGVSAVATAGRSSCTLCVVATGESPHIHTRGGLASCRPREKGGKEEMKAELQDP
ncbi:hypothetical protein FQA47_004880, partial [Oryzias melastigma]